MLLFCCVLYRVLGSFATLFSKLLLKQSQRIQCTLYIFFGFVRYNDVQSTAEIVIFLRGDFNKFPFGTPQTNPK